MYHNQILTRSAGATTLLQKLFFSTKPSPAKQQTRVIVSIHL